MPSTSRLPRPWLLPLLLVATFAVTGVTPFAAAQSQGELRRENERLLAVVEDLQRELEAIRQELATLRDRNAALVEQIAASGRPVPPARRGAGSDAAAPEVTIDESTPDASPRALLRAIVTSYQETMADAEPGAEGTPERVAFVRRLRRWTSRVNRQFRAHVEWHVRATEPAEPYGRAFALRLQAVDPVSGTRLGAPFLARVPRPLALRLDGLSRRGLMSDTMILRGTAQPEVRVNEARHAAGAFDHPPFVGPLAEFAFIVDTDTIVPVTAPGADRRNPPKATRPPGASPGADDEHGDDGRRQSVQHGED